ncbi:hypothetical protein VTO42DRAFT_3791 [Malbranchea cinnamomea]
MEGDENPPKFASAIPRPQTRSHGRSLHDITVAANNHATGSSMMLPPPGTISGKYKESLASAKTTQTRQTLAERAGETRSKPPSGHSMSRSLSSISRSQTVREPSSSSARSSRPPSAASSHHPSTLRPSNASSVGHGRRPTQIQAARTLARPQTSFGYAATDRTGSPRSKTTSMGVRDEGDVGGNILGKRKVWDDQTKLDDMMALYDHLVKTFEGTANHGLEMQHAVELYRSRVQELETKQSELTEQNINLRVELDTMKNRVAAAESSLQDAARNHEIALDDLERRHRVESESIRQEAKRQLDTVIARHEEDLREVKRRCESEIDSERQRRLQEIHKLNSQSAMDLQRGQMELETKARELHNVQRDLEQARAELEHERKLKLELQEQLVTANSNTVTLESSIRALKARIEFLESGSKEQSEAFARLDKQLQDALAETQRAKEKLRKEETLRRKLHNQVQELKGNIRVFCRVRPLLPHEPPEGAANIQFPDQDVDCREIAVQGPEERSSLGTITTKTHAFSFDHVFGPSSQNVDVFEEISQLVQSALDGYNVCIFCYGQTGSGKTHTMSSEDGMITRAVHQIYDTARSLEEKGWTYAMEGNFVEVYNENLNDLLGDASQFDKKKHEIRHDLQKCKTTITDITTVTLDSPSTVESILRRAASNRSVAATKANERSSRSHSVFILKLLGENNITGERSEGTLNLVDLAGSERLSQSGATGERLKETQNINRSLSCLGDVISALGQGKEGVHIPYRNSKLTYLLQFSLGGNSKTLMFVNVSPRREHLSETLTSLKFATKVHNTHIGTARRQTRVRD